MIQDAVIRNLEVIGQSVKDIGVDELTKSQPGVPWAAGGWGPQHPGASLSRCRFESRMAHRRTRLARAGRENRRDGEG